jgi:hypothetical protein
MMVRTLRQGLLAGLCAGFFAALLFIVDYGPANSLHTVARWLGLDSSGSGRFVGFALMLLLGAIFGALFVITTGRRNISLGRSLLLGLLTGVVWWFIVAFVLGDLVNHLRIDFGSWLFTFIPLLVYGLLLGSLSYQWRPQPA